MLTRLFTAVIFGLVLGLSQANAQVEFPSTRSSEGEIKRSVDSIDNFLYSRSNIRLSETVKRRLVDAERQVALGANSRLTSEQLINVLTEVALKRLPAPEIWPRKYPRTYKRRSSNSIASTNRSPTETVNLRRRVEGAAGEAALTLRA